MAVYYAPFIAVLLARLHLVEVARGRAAVVVGAVWLLFLVAAGALLTLSDANDESSTVHGPGGSITAPASDAAAFQGAVDAIAANTRPGEPILAAPFLTSLYVLAERPDPVLGDRAAARHVPHGRGRAGRHRGVRARRRPLRDHLAPLARGARTKRPSETPSGASSTAGSAATSHTCKR